MKVYTATEIEQYTVRIRDIIAKHPKTFGHVIKSSKNKDIITFLDSMFPLLADNFYKLNTKLYWLFNGLSDFPVCECPDCHSKILRNAFFYDRYPLYCSRSCAARDPKTLQKIQNTNLKRHGVKCTL